MQNWPPPHQASCLCLWANQRPGCRFFNYGAILSLHCNTLCCKIGLGYCNYEQWLISLESRMDSGQLHPKLSLRFDLRSYQGFPDAVIRCLLRKERWGSTSAVRLDFLNKSGWKMISIWEVYSFNQGPKTHMPPTFFPITHTEIPINPAKSPYQKSCPNHFIQLLEDPLTNKFHLQSSS